MVKEDVYPEGSRVCHSIRGCVNRVIDAAPDDSIFVESGGYLGNTTKHFVQKLLDSGKKFTYYVIDNWKLDNVTERHDDNLQFFKDNVGEELMKHVNIIASDALDAVQEFDDNSVFFCFLDDSHVYAHVTKQIGLWLPKMMDYSILAGDDYYCSDVSRAVNDHFRPTYVEKLHGNSGFLVENPKDKTRQ